MTPNEAISLQALLVALAQLDTTLPSELQQAIWRVGDALAHHQSEAIDTIAHLVRRHGRLHQLYDLAWIALRRYYQTQEYTLPRPPANDLPEEVAIALEGMVAQVLTSEDPVAAAHGQIKQTKVQSAQEQASGQIRLILDSLHEAVSTLESQTHAVLRALERRPLTIENLCYALQLSPDQVRSLVQYLWDAGYINPTTGNVLQKLFPLWRQTPHHATLDDPAYFTLTAKGHFHLHPIITAGPGPREGFSW